MSNQRQNFYIIILVAVLIMAWLTHWWFNHYTYGPHWKNQAWSFQAVHNPLLAAERLLTEFNYNVNSIRQLRELDITTLDSGTLVLSTPTFSISKTQAEQLLDWVHLGGHVILGVKRSYNPNEDNTPNYLLDFFSLTVKRRDSYGFDLYCGLDCTQEEQEQQAFNKTTPIHLQQQQFVADLCCFIFKDEYQHATWIAEDKHGIRALQYQYGQGYFTLLSDISIFNNRYIGQYDHAAILQALVQQKNHPKVGLQYLTEMPSLLTILWDKAYLFIISFSIALVLWLLWSNYRFGPIIQTMDNRQKNLLQHIEASGRFLWQKNQAEVLHQASCDELLKYIEHYHPAWQYLNSTELYQKLAQHTQLSITDINQAFTKDNLSQELAFFRKIQLLQLIRNRL